MSVLDTTLSYCQKNTSQGHETSIQHSSRVYWLPLKGMSLMHVLWITLVGESEVSSANFYLKRL